MNKLIQSCAELPDGAVQETVKLAPAWTDVADAERLYEETGGGVCEVRVPTATVLDRFTSV